MIYKMKEKILLNVIYDKCPITFVKTKIALERLKSYQYLEVHIKEGEALNGMPSSLEELGFRIKKRKLIKKGVYSLEITK